ncbi:IS3 family transposase [Corynebacterium rhinophilum]|uniref:IS3 family transposase n=1 Tax=Corynebacterium rhinophilum TaxID=3050197 RepID=UPI003977F55A
MWTDSDEVYGAPRITAELGERYQISVNRKTVAKRMRLMGIEGISPRAFVPVTTIQAKRKSSLPDLVRRMFDTGELNRVWMSDITYLRTSEGWLRLPSFSGHPISTDLVSVGEDVHCEFVKEEVHPGVPAGGRQTGH